MACHTDLTSGIRPQLSELLTSSASTNKSERHIHDQDLGKCSHNLAIFSYMLACSDNSTYTTLRCKQGLCCKCWWTLHSLTANGCCFQVHTLSHLCLSNQAGTTATPSLPPNHRRRTTRTSATTRPCSDVTRPGWSPLLEPSLGLMTCSCLLRSLQPCKHIRVCCSNVGCVIPGLHGLPLHLQTAHLDLYTLFTLVHAQTSCNTQKVSITLGWLCTAHGAWLAHMTCISLSVIACV